MGEVRPTHPNIDILLGQNWKSTLAGTNQMVWKENMSSESLEFRGNLGSPDVSGQGGEFLGSPDVLDQFQ